MIKHFCDLCGKEALEDMPTTRVLYPDQTWVGQRSISGGCVTGTWTPFVEMRIVFEHHETQKSSTPVFPDLCLDCVLNLIVKIRGELCARKERAIQEQAREGFQKMREGEK